MQIFLVRHGLAEEASSAGSDSARRLTPEGGARTAKVARAFRRRVDRVDLIFHSPYARAAETAAIFAREFPEAAVSPAKGLTPHDAPQAALPLIASAAADGCGGVMIVGHEPHLSSLASLLLTGKDSPVLELKKAGIAALECHGSQRACRLLLLLAPKWL